MAEREESMKFILVFLTVMGAWEAYVFYKNRYPEDLFLVVGCFGAVAFLTSMMLHGGIG